MDRKALSERVEDDVHSHIASAMRAKGSPIALNPITPRGPLQFLALVAGLSQELSRIHAEALSVTYRESAYLSPGRCGSSPCSLDQASPLTSTDAQVSELNQPV